MEKRQERERESTYDEDVKREEKRPPLRDGMYDMMRPIKANTKLVDDWRGSASEARAPT